MEGYMWLILVSMFGVGLIFGYFFSRTSGVDPTSKIKKLEAETRATQAKLDQANLDMEEYKLEVSSHFGKTAELFNQLTNDYRDVYEHLATSSEKLCGNQPVKLASLSADTKVLEAEALSDSDQTATTEEKPEAKAEAEPKPEVSSEANVEALDIDAERKANEARTVH